MTEKFSMKDAAFNNESVTKLAFDIKNIYPQFQSQLFLDSIFKTLFTLELKERSGLIRDALIRFLPFDYEKNLEILLACLPEENNNLELTGFDGFMMMPLCSYVSKEGLEYFELSTHALYELTKRFTSEFDIRFFIERYPQEMLELLHEWAHDDNVHVRRLVSEGTRPRLPWAFQLKAYIDDPSEVIKLLTQLKDDSELYVRRSVANNLNDISKDHPDLVVDTLKQWQNSSKEMAWLSNHALRTLIKAAFPKALNFLGFNSYDDLLVEIKVDKKEIKLGDELSLEILIHNHTKKKISLLIDYIVWYQKANGSLSPKVFKLGKKIMQVDTKIEMTKKHKFMELTTRKHHVGQHAIALQINGKVYQKETFRLNF